MLIGCTTEFLFRAKLIKDKNKWIVGSHFNDGGEDYILPNTLSGALDYENYQVDQNTICPCCFGVLDKHDKQIFHGDFIEHNNRLYICLWIHKFAGFRLVENIENGISYPVFFYNFLELTGENIIDNPELIDTNLRRWN